MDLKTQVKFLSTVYISSIGLNVGFNGFIWNCENQELEFWERGRITRETSPDIGGTYIPEGERDYRLIELREEMRDLARSGTIGWKVLVPGDFAFNVIREERELDKLNRDYGSE